MQESPGFAEVPIRHPEQLVRIIFPGIDEPPGRGELTVRCVFQVVGGQDHGVPAHFLRRIEVAVRVPIVDGRRLLAAPDQGDDRDGLAVREQAGQGGCVAVPVSGVNRQPAGARQAAHDAHLLAGCGRPAGEGAHAVKSPPQAVNFV